MSWLTMNFSQNTLYNGNAYADTVSVSPSTLPSNLQQYDISSHWSCFMCRQPISIPLFVTVQKM